MKLPYFISILLYCLLSFIGCQKVELELPASPVGVPTAITLQCAELPEIVTRATGQDDPIENVLLLIFNEAGHKINMAYQEFVDHNHQLSLYLSNEKQSLYALCNVPEKKLEEWKQITTLTQLQMQTLVIDAPSQAYDGKHVMVGQTLLEIPGKSIEILVSRLTTQLHFDIVFDPTNPKDQFNITAVYLHQLPKGSNLIEKAQNNSLEAAPDDYGRQGGAGDRANNYFTAPEWIELSTEAQGNLLHYKATFSIFENRQGAVEENNEIWNELKGLPPEDFIKYRQVYKRKLALNYKKGSETAPYFEYATYLTIHGIYMANGITHKVVYYVYLGKDNYRDFNLRRNTKYTYQISIHTKDITGIESRITWEPIGDLEIGGDFDSGEKIDAHFNCQRGVIYSDEPWTIRVKNPDETPWLEVSTSPDYIPLLAGEKPENSKASFRIEGNAGLHYFYVHTDEYVPEVPTSSPDQPDNQLNANGGNPKTRKGTLICELRGQKQTTKEIIIEQYAAQQVILVYDDYHPDETGAGKRTVRDTFYVERIQENKNINWGFNQYWSYITDDMIAAGQWDGLANTRRLYQVAHSGDKWGVPPAYPEYPNALPQDIAVGYAIEKNRDRNGNGKIDYNEIVWYLPSIKELKALSQAVHNGQVIIDDADADYHSSTPSVADPNGVTMGRAYYWKMSKQRAAIGERNRQRNVVCVRRAHTWLGPDQGNAGGNVDHDDHWKDDEEIIVPKPPKKNKKP